jgi:hypothetical protein
MDRSIPLCTAWKGRDGSLPDGEPAGKDLKREYKYYRLTSAGKKQLFSEESKGKRLTGAIARFMWPAEEG